MCVYVQSIAHYCAVVHLWKKFASVWLYIYRIERKKMLQSRFPILINPTQGIVIAQPFLNRLILFSSIGWEMTEMWQSEVH